jgi:RNA polymerase sigma factor (sigma-70 family)
MVPTPPTPHAGEAQVDYHWLSKLARWLELGRRKVAVLIESATAGGLRALVASLLARESRPVVCFHATELLDVPDDSLVVLTVQEAELNWLNLNRPIVANKRLRLILWLDFPLHRLRSRAPDFFDWISHVVRCPQRPPQFVVKGLLDAHAANRPVAWRGRHLDVALDAIGLGGARIAAGKEFAQVVATIASDRVPIWTEALDVWHSLRIELAMQHVQQEWWIVDRPGFESPRYLAVSDETLPWEAATERLMTAAPTADRSVAACVAALLEATPDAMEEAVRTLSNGVPMEALLRLDDVITSADPQVQRPERDFAPAYAELVRQHSVALLGKRERSEAWSSAADRARAAGHFDIAQYFAAQAFAKAKREPSRLRARITWASACHEGGQWLEAHERFQQALESTQSPPADPQTLAALLTAQALALEREGRYAESATEATQALETWVTCFPPTADLELECFRILGRSLASVGSAESMPQWLAKLEKRWLGHQEAQAYLALQRARNGDTDAQALLVAVLRRTSPPHGLIAVGLDFADLQLENGRPLSAAITCVRVLRHLRALHGTDLHPQAIDARLILGDALAEHDPGRAMAVLRRALADCDIIYGYGIDHPRTAAAALQLAGLLRQRGDIAASLTLTERAQGIYEALGADGDSVALSSIATALPAPSTERPMTAPRARRHRRPLQHLVEQAKKGDFFARDALTAHHHALVRRVLMGKVGAEDVDDLTQQVIARVFAGMGRLETDADLEHALLASARGAVLEYYRRRQRDRTTPLEEELMDLTDSLDPESRLGELENRAALARALREIPLDDQLLLHFVYFEGLPLDEIIQRVGAPTPAIRGRLRRAKQSLANALTSTAVDSVASLGAEREDGQGSSIDLLLEWIADMRKATA